MSRKQTKPLLALGLLSLLVCISARAQQTNDNKPAMNAVPAPIVRTASGIVRGVTEGDVSSFKGIPYGEFVPEIRSARVERGIADGARGGAARFSAGLLPGAHASMVRA